MRLLSLLIALVVVAFLILSQLDTSSKHRETESIESGTADKPRISNSPEGVRQFADDMDDYVESNADERRQRLEEALDASN